MPRRAVIVCRSIHHGNTARVAAALAAAIPAEVVSPEDCSPAGLEHVGLVGFGSGVYYGSMHPDLFDCVRQLPDASARSRPAFVFSTSGLPWLARVWHAPLVRALSRKGFRIVGTFHCAGHDSWGPLWLAGGINRRHPDRRDLERAGRFGRQIARAVWPENGSDARG